MESRAEASTAVSEGCSADRSRSPLGAASFWTTFEGARNGGGTKPGLRAFTGRAGGHAVDPWRRTHRMPGNLIYYALVLIVIALVAALLGFGGVAGTAMSGAHLLIWLAVVIVIVGVVFALIRRA
jgi:uncharacterized membrane protein YtjA (UPF0391 family)